MEEKYLITFWRVSEICVYLCRVSGEYWKMGNSGKCNEQTCPILKELERPEITQITAAGGK